MPAERRGIYRTVDAVPPLPMRRTPRPRDRTASSDRYLDRVRELACSCCDAPGPSSAHHPRFSEGGAQRAPDWLATALCYECHQGNGGVHGDKSRMRLRKLDEPAMVAITIARLNP